jgi:kynureninase
MDAKDPLRGYRDKFFIPRGKNGQEEIYLCGHSLGLRPKSARMYIEQELKDWSALGVKAHFRARHPWMPYHEFLATQTARIVGARGDEVVVMNSLTVNLHLMMISFYRPTPARHKILIESQPFPSDRYAIVSQIKLHGFDPRQTLLEIFPREGEATIRTEDVENLIDREGGSIALIMMSGVQYLTGQAFDMERITRAGHAKGCIVGFDLAHAAGNIPLKLHDWDVDFAVWCSYKYLNGSPGSLGGCFVHRRHVRNKDLPRLAGWWGHNKATRFAMPPEFDPTPSADGWQLSNPPILSAAALRASLDLFDEVGMEQLRTKGLLLTGYLEFLLTQLPKKDFTVITPSDPQQRGAQLSLRFLHNAKETFKRLSDANIVCDFREPDVIRVAPVPFYNSFADVYRFAQTLMNPQGVNRD